MSEARDILARLVALKDGPRDENYRSAKEAAWADARALLALEVCGNCGATKRPGEQHIAMTLGMCRIETGKSAADLRAERDALLAEIGREVAICIILGQEEPMMRDGDGWSLTNRAMIALDWLGAPRQVAARIAYRFRTRVAGAACPVCLAVVEVGDEAVQWTDDAITHDACAAEYPPEATS